MSRKFFSKDFNPDNADINLLSEDDGPFKRPGVCSLMNVPCDRISTCLQWGTVDCRMENMVSDYADPLELLIQAEQDPSFVELDKEEVHGLEEPLFELLAHEDEVPFFVGLEKEESGVRIEGVRGEHMEDVFKNLDDAYKLDREKNISEMVDTKIFELPKQVAIRKCAARRA